MIQPTLPTRQSPLCPPSPLTGAAVTPPFESAANPPAGTRIATRQPSDDLPAPGQYEPPAGGSGPAFTMAGRSGAPERAEARPGPGDYDIGGGKDRGKAFTMGVRLRDASPDQDRPGPGEYSGEESEWRKKRKESRKERKRSVTYTMSDEISILVLRITQPKILC